MCASFSVFPVYTEKRLIALYKNPAIELIKCFVPQKFKHLLVVAAETRNLMVRTPLYNKPSL